MRLPLCGAYPRMNQPWFFLIRRWHYMVSTIWFPTTTSCFHLKLRIRSINCCLKSIQYPILGLYYNYYKMTKDHAWFFFVEETALPLPTPFPRLRGSNFSTARSRVSSWFVNNWFLGAEPGGRAEESRMQGLEWMDGTTSLAWIFQFWW